MVKEFKLVVVGMGTVLFPFFFFVTSQSNMANIFGPFQVFWFVLLFQNIVVKQWRTMLSVSLLVESYLGV